MKPNTPAKRILIIDDETEMQLFLLNVLKPEAFQVSVAQDSEEGIKQARSGQPHLIILKDMMGKEGGKLLFIRLLQEPELASIPVILLSSLDQHTLLHYLRMQWGEIQRRLPAPALLNRPPEADELLRLANFLTNQV